MNLLELNKILNLRSKEIERKMKALEVRIKTGRLNNSISFKYNNGLFMFSAVNYGRFQDMGTYRNKHETDIGRKVWPKYIPKNKGGRKEYRGIIPLNFTKPMGDVNIKNIKSVVLPYISEAMSKDIIKEIKKVT